MLIWDRRWSHNESRVKALDSSVRYNLALACVDQAIEVLGPEFRARLSEDFRRELYQALSELWEGKTQLAKTLIERAPHDSSPGADDLAMAIATIANCSKNDADLDQVLEALSYCYQAVLDFAVLSRLKRSMTEDEINDLESRNELCNQSINGQLELLSQVESGTPAMRTFLQ